MPGSPTRSPARSPRRAASPKKKRRVSTPSAHPTYNAMICAAINSLKERGGSSRQAILKYILANYTGLSDPTSHVRLALRRGVQSKSLRQTKGAGASGRFRVGDVKPAVKKPKKKAAKKAKKPKRAKKPKAKRVAKPKAKKAAKAKKPKAKKAAKKPTAAKPAKKAVSKATKSKAKKSAKAKK